MDYRIFNVRTYVPIIMHAYTHGGWAHRQRISTTFLIQKNSHKYLGAPDGDSNLGSLDLEYDALPGDSVTSARWQRLTVTEMIGWVVSSVAKYAFGFENCARFKQKNVKGGNRWDLATDDDLRNCSDARSSKVWFFLSDSRCHIYTKL